MSSVRQCPRTDPHGPHQVNHHWKKADLPELKRPELFQKEWVMLYQCHGLRGDEDARVLAGLRALGLHEWFPFNRLCGCGAWFEASLEGHKLHSEHRMLEVLKAVNQVPDFCDTCGGPYGGWLAQYGGHWDSCPNRLN